MNLKTVLLDAKKAVGAAVAIEGTAVTLGLIDKPTDAVITAVLGAAVTAIVYLLDNVPKTPTVDPLNMHTDAPTNGA